MMMRVCAVVWMCACAQATLSDSSARQLHDGDQIRITLQPVGLDRERRSMSGGRGEGFVDWAAFDDRLIPPITDTFYAMNATYDNFSSAYEYSAELPRLDHVQHYLDKERRKEQRILSQHSAPKPTKHRNKNSNKKRRRKHRNRRKPKLIGEDACQYKVLRYCARTSQILPKKLARKLSDFSKCNQRQTFLNCVEVRRRRRACKNKSRARGNLNKLRSWIVNIFQTSYSCLLEDITH